MVLQSTSHDLWSRSSAAVYEDDDGKIVFRPAAACGELHVLILETSFGGNNDAFVKKKVGNLDRGIEKATGIIAQIQDKTFQLVLLKEFVESLLEILRGISLEVCYPHISISRF